MELAIQRAKQHHALVFIQQEWRAVADYQRVRTMLRRTFMSQQPNIRRVATTTNTVDSQEIKQFQSFEAGWWDEFGPVKGLHSMNKLRIPLIRDGLFNTGAISLEKSNDPSTLKDISILDVGCGGGILSEPLARLGSSITGIDANPSIIQLAKHRAKLNNLKINYLAVSIEDHAAVNSEKYDAVVASEILEHITEKEQFLEACVKCLKPTGSIFVTTMNKTLLAHVAAIMIGEYVVNLVPKGTHQIEKFIEPVKVQRMLENYNCRTNLVHGMFYNYFTNNWYWCLDTSINYVIHAVKIKK